MKKATSFGKPLPAVQGDSVTLAGNLTYVGAACDCKNSGFYCITCRQKLANRAQLDMHVEGAPLFIHVAARDCGPHGLTAPRARGGR